MARHRWIVASLAVPATLAGCLATPPTPPPDGETRVDAGDASAGATLDATVGDGASDAGVADSGEPPADAAIDSGCHVARSAEVLNDAVSIAGGGTYANGGVSHACALRADGTVVCWGDNSLGQLGVPQQVTLGTTRPVAVRFPADAGSVVVASIAAGGNSTYAIDTQLRLWAWGANDTGELANGTMDLLPHPEPSLVMLPDGGPLLVSSVAIEDGAYTTCAVDTTGTVLCWGNASTGLLGPGPYAADGSVVEVEVSTATPYRPELGSLGGGYVAGGYGGFCAVDNLAMQINCWGGITAPLMAPGDDGGVPPGETNSGAAEFIEGAGGVFPIANIDVGPDFTCVLDATHKVYCDQFPPGAPQGVLSLQPFDGGIDRIAIGYLHLCAIARTDGTVYCEGFNLRGQIGNGAVSNTGSVLVPSAVLREDGGTLTGASAVAAGLNFSCAILPGECGPTGGGTAYCWGDDLTGQLGSPPTYPVYDGGPTNVSATATPVLAPTP